MQSSYLQKKLIYHCNFFRWTVNGSEADQSGPTGPHVSHLARIHPKMEEELTIPRQGLALKNEAGLQLLAAR